MLFLWNLVSKHWSCWSGRTQQWFFTSDEGGGICDCTRLSVCLLARLLKNACMDLDEILRVDRCQEMDELINF